VGLSAEARSALEWVSADFELLTTGVPGDVPDAPSDGTRWTNRELLFHMWFGQRIARVFIPLVGGFSRLPPPVSRGYARLLAELSRPYEWVNYAGAVAGARVGGLARARRWMAGDTAAILRWADASSDADLARGMSVPAAWDPYFSPWMSRRDLLEWAPKHYRHHRDQLTIPKPEAPDPGVPRRAS
jgi:hypothetical protein